jgi:hypothetical protein
VKSREARETTLEALVQSIRTSDTLRVKTKEYRRLLAENKPAAQRMKKSFAGFLPAALVNGRRLISNVTALTGLVMCDFDHVPADRIPDLRTRVNADPHTLFSYVTLSGQGLRILACYDHEEAISEVTDKGKFSCERARRFYAKMFESVNKYYSNLLGVEYDLACKDLTRMSLAAYDAEAYFLPIATPFTMAECGIASQEERMKEKDAKRQKNKNLNMIAVTYKYKIVPFLKHEGTEYKPGNHNNYVMRVGYILNKYGFELDNVMEWAAREFPDYPEAASTVKYCYNRTEEHGEWADRLGASAGGDGSGRMPRASRLDIIAYLNEKMDIRHNLVLGLTEMRWKNAPYVGVASPHSKDRSAFTHDIDAMVKSVVCLMEQERGMDASKEKVYDAIENDLIAEFDPLTDYLHHLPAWNADTDPDYLAELADTVRVIDADPNAHDLFRRCLKKWFVWMLVGWTRPDEVNQTILQFIGAQGTFKSTWMKSLMPPQLREYFKIKQNSGEVRTDDLISMSRYGLILHEESDVMSARESNTLKAMVTAQHSDERAPYGRAPRRRQNIASLCATGNSEQFLSNEQGTRRSLVFRVEVIQSPLDHPFHYEGIYSQAYALMQSGFQYYFSKEEQAELECHNRQFETANREEAAIQTHLGKPHEGPGDLVWMPVSQIAEHLSARSGNHARYDDNRIGQIMDRLGYPKGFQHDGSVGYCFILRDYDEVRRQQKQKALDATPKPTGKNKK